MAGEAKITELEERLSHLEAKYARLLELAEQCAVTAHGAVMALTWTEMQVVSVAQRLGVSLNDPTVLDGAYEEARRLERMMSHEESGG